MLDRDEIQDELVLEAGRRNANPLNRSFKGIDLTRFDCVLRDHCSAEFLAKVELSASEVAAVKNFQPFLRLSVDGVTVYQETAFIKNPHVPRFGVREWVWYWVPRATARRLTGSLGATYPNYGEREYSVKFSC